MFKVGDKVVFVEANPGNPWSKLQKEAGNVLTVKDIKPGFMDKKGEEQLLYFEGEVAGFFGKRFALHKEPVVKAQDIKVGSLVRILPCPDHFKNNWAMGRDYMDGMVGNVYSISRPLGLNGEHWYIRGKKMEFYFHVDGLELIPDTYDGYYAEAKRMNIPGRGKMNKQALRAAIIDQAPQVAPVPNKAAVEAPRPLPEPPKKPAAPVKPLLPLEEALREKVGDEEREFSGSEVSSFAYEYDGGKRHFSVRDICHASMRNSSITKVVEDVKQWHIIHQNPDGYAMFLDWFVNESVFAPAFVTKNWREKSLVLNTGMHKDAIVSTQVALRQMHERQGKLGSWLWYVEKGYDKNMSYLLSNLFEKNGDTWSLASMDNGHAIFYSRHSINDLVKFFRDGKWNIDDDVKSSWREYGFSVFDSFARQYNAEQEEWVSRWRAPFFVNKVVSGWNAKAVVNEDKLIECAEKLKEMWHA